MREKVFRKSGGFRFIVRFVDCTSVFVKSVLETSLSLGETNRRLKDRFNDYQMVSITT